MASIYTSAGSEYAGLLPQMENAQAFAKFVEVFQSVKSSVASSCGHVVLIFFIYLDCSFGFSENDVEESGG